MGTRRRFLFLGGGAAAWVAAFQVGPDLWRRFGGLRFEPYPRVEGFRTIAGGTASGASGGFDFTLGLDERAPFPPGLMEAIRADPTAALFPEGGGGAVPVAYFFDYYCPYCRVLSGHLGPLAANGAIALSHQHWPIFGAASELAARASLAAERQGAGRALHAALLSTSVRITPPFLRRMAEDVGLSWPQLERDMEAPEVTAALDHSRALAEIFAFVGTPSMVVGRTVVEGEIAAPRLRDLVRYEREDG